jgi:hypothetical protein
LTSPAFQIGYLVWTLFVFGVVTLVTRPGRRRLLGAVVAIVVFTAISAPIDELAARWNLWTYPECNVPPHPSIAIYLGQSTMFVGCLASIGGRVQRAFGVRGLLVLTVMVLVLGPIRDFGAAAILPDLIRFGPQPAALLGDVAAWAVVVIVALGVTRLVGGPARDVSASRATAR